jgi:hypothetical protein
LVDEVVTMAIEFHCEHCGKTVRAKGEHAGKRGRCPSCQQSVYIPTPDDELEPLDFAPVDEDAQRREEEMLRESQDLARQLRSDREAAESGGSTPPSPRAPTGSDALLSKEQLRVKIISYVQEMAAGNLEAGEKLADDIHQQQALAEPIIDNIAGDEIPPEELSDVPRPVLQGFLRQLRESG